MQSNLPNDFFRGVALEMWRRAVSPEQTRAEADFLEKVLQAAPRAKLLDVPCGNGRHAVDLAHRGYSLTGVDSSEEFLADARAATSLPIRWILGDMCELPWESEFEGAYYWDSEAGFKAVRQLLASSNVENIGRGLLTCAGLLGDRKVERAELMPLSTVEQFIFHDDHALCGAAAWVWGAVFELRKHTPAAPSTTLLDRLLSLYFCKSHPAFEQDVMIALRSQLGLRRGAWRPMLSGDQVQRLKKETELGKIQRDSWSSIAPLTIAWHARNFCSDEELGMRLAAIRASERDLPPAFLDRLDSMLGELGETGKTSPKGKPPKPPTSAL